MANGAYSPSSLFSSTQVAPSLASSGTPPLRSQGLLPALVQNSAPAAALDTTVFIGEIANRRPGSKLMPSPPASPRRASIGANPSDLQVSGVAGSLEGRSQPRYSTQPTARCYSRYPPNFSAGQGAFGMPRILADPPRRSSQLDGYPSGTPMDACFIRIA